MATFVLTIDIGNDAMQTHADVSEALNDVARGVREDHTWDGKITDGNGNTVGEFDLMAEDVEARRADSIQAGECVRTMGSGAFHEVKDVRAGRNEGQVVLDAGWGQTELRPEAVVYTKA